MGGMDPNLVFNAKNIPMVNTKERISLKYFMK
jgi:hypothetical protein